MLLRSYSISGEYNSGAVRSEGAYRDNGENLTIRESDGKWSSGKIANRLLGCSLAGLLAYLLSLGAVEWRDVTSELKECAVLCPCLYLFFCCAIQVPM